MYMVNYTHIYCFARSLMSLSLSLSLSLEGTTTKLAYPFGLAQVRYDILIILIQITNIFQRNQGKAG